MGRSGREVQRNITDPHRARMKSARGVISGYDGLAVVDAKHQIIVNAEAFGEGQENALLEPMLEGTKRHFEAIAEQPAVLEQAVVVADAGFHSEANAKYLLENGIDGYLADTMFRKRDPRFASAERHVPPERKRGNKLFGPEDFLFDPQAMRCVCPAGRRLYRNGVNVVINGHAGVKFHGAKRDCVPCELRARCLQHPERTPHQAGGVLPWASERERGELHHAHEAQDR